MKQEIEQLKRAFSGEIESVGSTQALEEIEVRYLGRKGGKVTELLRGLKNLPDAERKEVGPLLQGFKKTVEDRLQEARERVSQADTGAFFDPTLPGTPPSPKGHLHLVTQAMDEITRIFERIGFTRRQYPEVEWDWYAFESLNMPKDHPARDEWETFFIDAEPIGKMGKRVLTPHTSSGQVREMERGVLPIRMINISKCYRRQSDISHVPMFHQFEGLVVDKGIAITHLKGTLEYFFREFYGPDRAFRLRPFHFRFTEPSFEIDISCDLCKGHGCKMCKAGWLELGGAGMVHPNVLKAGKIDPKKYSGFAFGWGVERVYLMKQGLKIPDIRMLYGNDMRFLQQF